MKRLALLALPVLFVGGFWNEETQIEEVRGSGVAQSRDSSEAGIGARRWVYAYRSLQEEAHVSDLLEIARRASEAGMNGMVLSGGYRNIDRASPAYIDRLRRVREGLSGLGVELIPIFMTVGYGDGLERNPNLAAGIPVRDALFVARSGKAELVADPPASIRNGGFEETEDGAPAGFVVAGTIGGTLSLDPHVFRSGKQSLRFDGERKSADDPGYVRKVVAVRPHRSYVLRTWIRTEGMERPRDFALGHIRVEVRGQPDGRRLQFHDPGVPVETDWIPVSVGFNSWEYEEVEISIGNETSRTGRFWLDDLEVAEVGPVNVLRRPGTPVSVRGEETGAEYREGIDFMRIEDPLLNHRFDHDAPPILLGPETRIREGERLRISWYHSAAVFQSQVSICMSEPEIYEIWKSQTRALHETLRPRTYLLSMDEVRAGGSCEACVGRGIPMGQIYGDCVTRQVKIIREINPDAEIAIWSDMLDPHHNARRNPYYLVKGDFDGSWSHVPKDLVIAVWGRRVRPESLEHFSGLGFRTLGAAYYDTDDLEDVPGWLEVMKRTPGAAGMMYTTWLNKYDLLPEFGRLLEGPTPDAER